MRTFSRQVSAVLSPISVKPKAIIPSVRKTPRNMTIKSWLPLIGITLCVFIFNMSEFMPIGLLTDISKDFGISESRAGLIISVYAWAVAIISLPIMLALRKMQYRMMLLMTVFMFAVFQIISGVSSSYWMLMVSRLGVAVAHSIFWSIAAPLAVRVVSKDYEKLALSTVAAGTSIAMIIGLPLGRIIGLALGWRMSFIIIASVSILVLILLVAVFPKVENPGTFTVKRLPDIFRNKVLMGIYIIVAVFVTGYYTGYSYIEPFLAHTGIFSENMITVALTLFGLAGIGGSVLFTRYYDRTRFRFMVTALGGASMCLLLLNLVAFSVWTVMVVCMVWGVCSISFNVSTQNEAIRAAPDDAVPIAMSLYSGIYNVGIAMGSIIGGLVTDHGSVADIGYVGAAFTISATLFLALYVIGQIKRRESMLSCGCRQG